MGSSSDLSIKLRNSLNGSSDSFGSSLKPDIEKMANVEKSKSIESISSSSQSELDAINHDRLNHQIKSEFIDKGKISLIKSGKHLKNMADKKRLHSEDKSEDSSINLNNNKKAFKLQLTSPICKTSEETISHSSSALTDTKSTDPRNEYEVSRGDHIKLKHKSTHRKHRPTLLKQKSFDVSTIGEEPLSALTGQNKLMLSASSTEVPLSIRSLPLNYCLVNPDSNSRMLQQHHENGPLTFLYNSSHNHHHHHVHHPVLPITRRPSRLPADTIFVRPPIQIKAKDALATTFSALYGKLLVVMGIAFPMAEVISTYIPPSFYEGFYLYLYVGSMVFLLFMYVTLIWNRPSHPNPIDKKQVKHEQQSSSTSDLASIDESDTESEHSIKKTTEIKHFSAKVRRQSVLGTSSRHHYGSFYLRMGAVAFGIGSMIYSGLEFGQYFELERDTKCHNVMLALTPATRMAFIFIQMYFIFLNNEQMKVYRHKIIARFGLMHMIGTNLSVWLSVLIQETKHEILTFYNPENRTLRISHRLGNKVVLNPLDQTVHLRVARGLKGPHHIFECRRTNIIGTLVQDASPFLFPCTIEYSLICAAILYVMWRGICRPKSHDVPIRLQGPNVPYKRSPHHYSVDCARAHKGLFIGILILVLTIISLILFFVLISRPEFVTLAVTEVTICELILYATSTIATILGMVQVRHLQYDVMRRFQLDDILLVGAQTGLFLYSTFTVIGGHFTFRRDTVLILINALASIVQTACQTMFILDASRRTAATAEHMRKKPGREIVTFLLVANLAMWAISTLEKSRAESHPIQLNFYGLWAWTIITHVSMPLAIFYRFHSTVCLCEIWKRAYKIKSNYL